ncbi:RNA/RNP complex-1-interacting phosphatase [Triplophysa rosa]|nr:RNA/RNP complex-1-interacting phosphatase [Triplophysa rosa]
MPFKKNGIPDRWTDYTAVGKRIPGTRFIAFKVPLKESLSNRLTQMEAFGPFDLVNMLEKEGQELGLIIDLTFTTRYYKPVDLPNTLHYLKIFTAGHEVPSDATILSFKKAVRHFLRENEDNDKLIGVHCTHGLNRTGYLVCRYLIDVDGMKPRKAIDLFNESRGHSIERQNYLDDLMARPKRSNEGIEEPDQEPVLGCLSLTQDPPSHQSERHNYASFNGQRPHPGHRGHQPQFFPNNSMMRFGPPQQLRPPLFSTPPPGIRFMRPPHFNQSFRGHHMRFDDSWEDPHALPFAFPAEGCSGPQGPRRKNRHRFRKGAKDQTPRGNAGDFH